MFEKKRGKRFLASVMALVMLLSLAPVGTLAADETPTNEECSAMPLPAVEGKDQQAVVTDEQNTENTNEETTPPPSNEGDAGTPADNNDTSTAISEMPVIMNPVDLLNQASDYTTELTWKPSSSIKDATFFYLKTPTSKLNSNKAEDWGPALGNGTINTEGLIWVDSSVWGSGTYVENATNVTNSNVKFWPSTHGEYDSGKDGYVLTRDGDHWNSIFGAYKDSVEKKLGITDLQKSDITDIILKPFKVSRFNKTDESYHVDCKVEVKCTQVVTATFNVKDVNDDDYVQVKAENYKSGSQVNFPSYSPEKAGHKFSGWYFDRNLSEKVEDNYTIGNENVDFYAKYTPKTYTVTWVNYDGTVLETDGNVEYNSTPHYNGATPERAAETGYIYEFKGWNPEISPVTGDVTYTAEYNKIANKYTVTWVNYDGTVLETDGNVEYNSTPHYNGATPERAAETGYIYEFKGWNPEISPVTGDVTYTAEYNKIANKYTVTWVNYDGTVLETDGNVEYNSTPHYNGATPERAAETGYIYEFKGWNPEISPVTGDVTYTAEYNKIANKYTVTWVNYDGTVLETDGNVEYNSTPHYNGATPERAAETGYIYEFKGWNPEISPVTGDVTYTAEYNKIANKYTVTWVNYDGTVLETDGNVEYNSTPHYNGATPERAAETGHTYEFKGWTPEISPVTGDVTYTAEYTATKDLTYTIIQNFIDGKGNPIEAMKKETPKTIAAEDAVKVTDLNTMIPEDMQQDFTDSASNKYMYVPTKTEFSTTTLVNGTKINLYYYLDNWKDGSSVEEDNDKGGDGIPDCDQVLIKYVSSNSERGTVSPDMEVLTLRKDNENVQIKINGSKATDNGGRNYFSNWTEDNTQVSTNATLNHQTILDVIKEFTGGKTYTFTANFGYSSGGGSGGSNRPKPPVVEIPDDVPTGLNGKDHYAYIIGYGNNDVRPQNNITRAEVATIFFRLLTDETREANMTKSNSYNDVKDGDWFCCAVSTLSKMGIIKGYEDGSFKPNDPISRAEFAAIAARFDPDGDKTPATFFDVSSHWAKDEISIAANHGWIKGYEDGSFKPDQKITRAETMTLVNRVLNRLPETKDDLHKDMKTWVDNMDETAWYYLAVQEATNSHYFKNKTSTKFEQWTDLRDTRDWSELEK